MMIEGITHENGALHKVAKFRGKISAGYAPGEGPNKENHPVQAGFYRILKEVLKTKRIGASQTPVNIKEWILNDEIQKKLEESQAKPNANPRTIEIVSLYKTIDEMWESSLSLFSSKDGLVCKSHGKGTNARYLQYDKNGERMWINRVIDDKAECNYEKCPDYQKKLCKPMGILKCFPTIDLAPNPYRFDTRSINTIVGIESSLEDLRMLLYAAHSVKEMEAGQPIPFDGFFGAKLVLKLKKIKSGGRDVYITDIMPTQEFTEIVMEPIKRGLETKSKQAKLAGSAGSISMLEMAGNRLLEGSSDVEYDDIEDNDTSIATQFNADAEDGDRELTPEEKAVEALLNEGGDSPEK